MNKTMREELLDTLAYCWVRGWYAGTDGERTDAGKRQAAHEELDKLLERWGLQDVVPQRKV